MSSDLESSLFKGLTKGYNQNHVLHVSFDETEKSIVEYLLTVNVAQQLLDWNSGTNHAIFLEHSTEKFFKNAFLPYMQVGDNIFDMDIIHPEVTKSIDTNAEIRTGRIDLVICREKIGFYNHYESLFGIELKGMNPNTDKVIEDIKRLVLAIEMKDDKFKNSIQAGYCLHIKKLGGDKRLSTKKSLEDAMKKSISYLENIISENIKAVLTEIVVLHDIISIRTSEDFAQQENRDDISADEVAEGTKIVYSVIIKIARKQKLINKID